MPDFIGQTIFLSMLLPLLSIIVVLVLIVFAIQRNYQIKKLDHEERMRALELGYDVPPSPKKRKPVYPYAWPFVFMGFGLALLGIAIFADGEEAAIGFGLISFFIGLGLFASRHFGVKKEEMEAIENGARVWNAPKKAVSEPEAQPSNTSETL